MTKPMEMPVALRLWTQARPRAYQCLYHPFVTALGAGTLPRACFEQFLLQDAFYLQGFSKAFAHAVTKASDMKHVLALIRLMNGMEQELATHTAFLQSFGIDTFQVQQSTAAQATTAYVDFLLQTAKQQTSVAAIITTMTPCMRLYTFLGRRIHAATAGRTDLPYQRWVDAYAVDEFEGASAMMEQLLDDLVVAEQIEFETLVPLYNHAMHLELNFFNAFFPYERAQSLFPPASLSSLTVRLDVVDDPERCSDVMSACKAAVFTLVADDAREWNEVQALDVGSYDVQIDLHPSKNLHLCVRASTTEAGHSPASSLLQSTMQTLMEQRWPIDGVVVHASTKTEFIAFLQSLSAVTQGALLHAPPPRVAGHHQPKAMPARVLIVAGSDSGGGAGIQADMKACTNLGVFSSTAITAVTVQNTHGVHAIHSIPPHEVVAQMACVLDDIGADVVKTGMLFDQETIDQVAAMLAPRALRLVVDPVMVATSGHRLMKDSAISSLVSHLFPLATVITPNIPEASALLRDRAIETLEQMKDAAQALAAWGSAFVLIKGGHLKTDDAIVLDVLYEAAAQQFHVFRNARIQSQNTHGTGCTLASAIAAELAKNPDDVVLAVRHAIAYVHTLLQLSRDLPLGQGEARPMLHVL